MTLTIEIPELIGARIKDNPEGLARAQRELAREFAGIDLDAVEAILESFTEEGEDIDHEEAFARAEAKTSSWEMSSPSSVKLSRMASTASRSMPANSRASAR